MTPTDEEVDQLRRQNAMLMRALMRAKLERDALSRQLAALAPHRDALRTSETEGVQ